MITITKKDLVALGYGPSYAASIIKEAKRVMISRGHVYYESRKLDRVPTDVVEEILGIKIQDDESTKKGAMSNRKISFQQGKETES